MLAVGEQVSSGSVRAVLRAANGFRGGVASTHAELCGALAAGVMIIGMIYGRDDLSQDDSYGKDVTLRWRLRFAEHFGATRCQPIYDRTHAPDGPGDCAGIAREASVLLLEVLDEASTPAGAGSPVSAYSPPSR